MSNNQAALYRDLIMGMMEKIRAAYRCEAYDKIYELLNERNALLSSLLASSSVDDEASHELVLRLFEEIKQFDSAMRATIVDEMDEMSQAIKGSEQVKAYQ